MTQGTEEPRYEEAFVDVVGARVYYLHAGSGKPMLLIHGLLGSATRRTLASKGVFWDPVMIPTHGPAGGLQS